jgi:hypothetical protein
MRKIVIFFLVFFMFSAFILSGCGKNPVFAEENISQISAINNFEGVTMTAQHGTSTGLTLVFRNSTDKECLYGNAYSLQIYNNGKWYKVPYRVDDPVSFTSIGYMLSPGGTASMDVDWTWPYGKLPAGKYRIIKSISDFRGTGDYDDYILAAEFSLD